MYPRRVYKNELSLKVWNENEEIAAAADGYESHRNAVIVAQRKGTEKAILTNEPVIIKPVIDAPDVDPVTEEKAVEIKKILQEKARKDTETQEKTGKHKKISGNSSKKVDKRTKKVVKKKAK